MKIRRIDHVAIAVEDLNTALPFFTDVLGLEVTHTDVEEGQGVVVAFLPAGDSEIELIEPVDAGSGVARFLQRRGPGMHHLCLEVDDMDAALARLHEKGVQLIDETPYIGTGGRRIAFIHPKSAHGVLVELYEVLPGERRRRLESVDELRRRLVVRSRVAAAGTRGFIDSLRRRRADAPDSAPEPPPPSARSASHDAGGSRAGR